jgi:hypothetical protein
MDGFKYMQYVLPTHKRCKWTEQRATFTILSLCIDIWPQGYAHD